MMTSSVLKPARQNNAAEHVPGEPWGHCPPRRLYSDSFLFGEGQKVELGPGRQGGARTPGTRGWAG